MPVKIQSHLTARRLQPQLERLFDLSAQKLEAIERSWDPASGAPVFTVRGRYTSKGWTEWTQGFQFGSALVQFDATGQQAFFAGARRQILDRMASHLTHRGVHDHGFNNISTYGHWWRLMRQGKIPQNDSERHFLELALKVSGAVQAARWTRLEDGTGFIYSFNGPHSLFIDTMRSLRSLAVAYQLGHVLSDEHDQRISLLQRLLQHAANTARYAIYYGQGRDAYDLRGRVAHESIFNLNDGRYRCPNSQQGYSPFTTWTRGLAWAICGFAEQLEFLRSLSPQAFGQPGEKQKVMAWMLKAAQAASDFYLDQTPTCGIPYWDTGAPQLHRLGDYLQQPADPFNPWEPVDSSAAAIAAQGLIRLGRYLQAAGQAKPGARYKQAGLTVAQTLLDEPYLSNRPQHQGLLLHSVYHRPNGWDYIPKGQKVPNGESSMWGDYHLRELALLLLREARQEPYPTFWE